MTFLLLYNTNHHHPNRTVIVPSGLIVEARRLNLKGIFSLDPCHFSLGASSRVVEGPSWERGRKIHLSIPSSNTIS